MALFQLTEITTQDGLVHQGIFFRPNKLGKKALLWVHGLTGKFYGDVKMMNEFARACEKNGFGFASFNNRGHDMMASARKKGIYTTIGSANEVFEECVLDIRAAVEFLVQKGFSEIVLVGRSTGANKVCYYAATQKDQAVCGIVLVSPISDRLAAFARAPWYTRLYLQFLVAIGRGEIPILGVHYFPGTPKRFLSLISHNSKEDIFNYGDDTHTLSRFTTIDKPIMVVLGDKDKHADRPVKEIQQGFDTHTRSKKYISVVLPGADHGFSGKEKEVVDHIISWVREI